MPWWGSREVKYFFTAQNLFRVRRFLSFISSAVFCSKRGLWQTSRHSCHCFAIATGKLLLLAAALVDWAIDAGVQTVMDSLLCKLPHPINATSVHQQSATTSSPFLQTEDTLTVVRRIVKYFGFLETTLGSMVRHLTQDMSFCLHCLCAQESLRCYMKEFKA